MTGYEFGDEVRGVVADENDWGTCGPRIVRPRREATGQVVGMYSAAADVVAIQTGDGERVCIRSVRRVHRRSAPAPSLTCPACNSADFSLQLGGRNSGAVSCAACGFTLDSPGAGT